MSGLTLEDGEWHAADRVIFNGDAAAIADGHLGSDVARAVPQIDKRHRSLSAVTWAGLAETQGLPAHAPQRVFLARLPRRVRRHLRASASCPPIRRSMSARRIATTTVRMRTGAERLLSSTNAPPNGDRTSHLEIEPCRDRTFRQLERCGLTVSMSPSTTRDHDAAGFRPGLSGDRRSPLRPGLARLDGVVPPAGSAQPDCRAFIWRAAACIRDRACRWRRYRGGWRRRP